MPSAVAKEFWENDRLKKAEPLGTVETWMSESLAAPKRA
jgi:hypothetical protein